MAGGIRGVRASVRAVLPRTGVDNTSPKERNSGDLFERKAGADAISDGQILLREGEAVVPVQRCMLWRFSTYPGTQDQSPS